MADENTPRLAYSFEQFRAAHRSQLIAADVPEILWPRLFSKLANEIFDAGEYMTIIYEEPDRDGDVAWKVLVSQNLKAKNENAVFLIDHAWSFRHGEARLQLRDNEQLLSRVAAMVGEKNRLGEDDEETDDEIVDGDGDQKPMEISLAAKKEQFIDAVMEKMWKYLGTYSLRFNKEDEGNTSVWYLMDELGSRIGHSRSSANARLVPLFFVPHGIAYSILFFTMDIPAESEILCDWTESLTALQHPEWVEILEWPWCGGDFSGRSTERLFPNESFFLGGRVADTLPSSSAQSSCSFSPRCPLRVFSDDVQLLQHLKTVQIEAVDKFEDADVVWLRNHFHDFKDLAEKNPGALVNQFPCESCLTTKDLFAAILCKNGQSHPFHQMAFNLNTELPQFVEEFQKNEKNNEDNTWIIKPWNLARGLDMYVSDSLTQILRLVETGPKIACKYITRPLLFPRPDNGQKVKFDLRFIVFVNRVRPLDAYIYNNFWIRFAIKEFSLKELDDVETHFTVFNYADPSKILQMKCEDFVAELEQAYPQLEWLSLQSKINEAIATVLKDASSEEAPRGVAANVQSRAMYGIDVMLHHDSHGKVVPSVLEVNFMPDCTRACNYYPDFADTVFQTMFFNQIDLKKVTKLS